MKNIQDNIYRLYIVGHWNRKQKVWDGFQIIWNFPTISHSRTGGYLNSTVVFSNLPNALKYCQKYILHYPIKNITWEIKTPFMSIVEI